MRKRTTLLVLIWLMLPGLHRLRGTTVVFIRTPQHIVVADDSLVSHFHGGQQLPPTTECKLRMMHNVYFADATEDVDAKQVLYLAGKALKNTNTVKEAAQKLSTMGDELAQGTLGMPQALVERYWNKTGAETAFFGMENGVPTIVFVFFGKPGVLMENSLSSRT